MEDNFTFFMAFLPTKYESTATTTESHPQTIQNKKKMKHK